MVAVERLSAEVQYYGLCDMCGQEKPVKFCRVCNKWLCDSCRKNIPGRIIAAVRERI